MNKKIFFVCLVFALVFTGMLTAKSIGLNLEAGAAYTNHQLHYFDNDTRHDGFKHQGIKSKSLFGFNLGVSYPLPKNWSVFVSTVFAFNRTFVSDTMLGAGYTFKPGKGFDLFLGGGLAFGGSVFKWSSGNVSITNRFFNIGAGINLTASFMFTNKIGMFAGISNTYYKPVSGKWSNKIGDKTTSGDIASNHMPDLAKSISGRLGVKIKL
ncbi:DUF2715 domain-containing protein [Treponema sp. OMZ 792]|uniref:DUF2715 domain-containing protein n=1 Tax=unclassified Treponema TaxID=2638727 RepID=UPI0020A4E0D3|nr:MULTISPECIES: DUF2715 domain-containing protein [unclassified Treponema]UTC75581.1 DUF2715 domain-containing protein [Treponema sp. OMZ 792]UTC79583.1 DUF2715 domain-containing protein [Treponema sp. OMZ 798]